MDPVFTELELEQADKAQGAESPVLVGWVATRRQGPGGPLTLVSDPPARL